MTYEDLLKNLEQEDVPATDDQLTKFAEQMLVDKTASQQPQVTEAFVNKVAAATAKIVMSEFAKAGLKLPIAKKAEDLAPAANPTNEQSPNPFTANPADQPPAEAQPAAAQQVDIANAMMTPENPGAVAAAAADPATAVANSADVVIQDPDAAELSQNEMEAMLDTAQRLMNDGVTNDPVAAVAAASLAIIQDSVATDQTAQEAATDATQGSGEAMAESLAAVPAIADEVAMEEKLSEMVYTYGTTLARDIIKEYLRENMIK